MQFPAQLSETVESTSQWYKSEKKKLCSSHEYPTKKESFNLIFVVLKLLCGSTINRLLNAAEPEVTAHP